MKKYQNNILSPREYKKMKIKKKEKRGKKKNAKTSKKST